MFYPVNGDPYHSNVVLHVPFTGANNSTTFTDVSPTPKTLTRYGDTKISTTQSKWGQGAGYFDGTGDYLSLTDSDDWFFNGDFTLEVYAYLTVDVLQEIICQRNSGAAVFPMWLLRVNSGGSLRFYHSNPGTVITDITSSTTVGINNWNHIALTRESGTAKIWVNGIQSSVTGTNLTTAYQNSTNSVAIGGGSVPASDSYFNGYLQDLRITKGVARYSADFAVPAGPLPARLPELPVQRIIQPSFNAIARLGL